MTREIVLDTETTGLSPKEGHRLVEIGCVELFNHVPTGRNLHIYLNPERDMPEEAFRVHGLSDDFLRRQALFADKAQEFIDFLGDATLIIHNAPFDMGFLNAELETLKRPALANTVIDTVMLARNVHPGARVSLDALCRHYGIDNARRTLHGALLDSEILAEVYLELIGGRQVALSLSGAEAARADQGQRERAPARQRPSALPARLSEQQIARHRAYIAEMGEHALWTRYLEEDAQEKTRAVGAG